MALNKKFFPKVSADADVFTPSEHFNTVLYTGNGSTQRIGGYINRGGVFNGSSSYIQVNSIPTNDTFSLSFWINATDPNSDTTLFHFYDSGNHIAGNAIGIFSSGTQFGWFPHTSTGGAGFTGISASDTNALFDGSWHNVVIVSDANSFTNSKIYIDGVEKTLTISNSYTTSVRMEGTLYFGRRQDGYGDYNGKLDQVRIFNKALSSSEVTTLYGETHASTTISTTDIFSDNSGVALYQLDGNANDTGGVSGKFGSAAHFNGSSSQIDLNYASLGMGVNNFSYSFWFKLNSTSGVQTFFQVLSEHINYGLRINDTYNLQSSPTNSSGGAEYIGSNVTLDTNWHHVAYVKSSTNGHSLWYDGTKVAEDTNFTGNVQATTTNKTTLGSATNDINWLNGFLDDVRFYNDELTSTEIGYIYNNTTASIPTDNLVAYYKFDGDARDEQQLYDGTATNVSYAYDGTATNVTYQEATNFQPDLVWIKGRVQAQHSGVFDSVRGADLWLRSGTTDAENNFGGGYGVTSFDSNGFTIGSGSAINNNGDGNVAWCFKGGGTAVSNTDGGVTSQVSANTDAGFSIATWTYSSGTNTVGHGLSSAPELIIYKKRNAAQVWLVFTTAIDGSLDYNYLNTDAFSNSSLSAPTNTVFSIDTGHTGDYVGYCFHSVDGYSKIGSYTGTGTTSGNLIETGFEPAFVMIKRTDSTGDWRIWDSKRDTDATKNNILKPNTSEAESTNDASAKLSFLSNGFEPISSHSSVNASSASYIYLAIAADPDTTTPTVENSFDVVTYTGNGTDITVNTDFKPDMVWIKERTSTSAHRIVDSVRGDKKRIFTNTTDAESTVAAGEIFLENGFQIGADNGSNQNGEDYVAWVWKAGDHDDNLPQINTEGSIDSVVSVNAEAGFSIVKYTGNGTAGSTIGHGLSSTPQMIIIKNLDGTANWAVYTETTGTNATLLLNSTSASTSVSNKYAGTNSTVFGVNSASDVNTSGNEYIAYCFHSVSGYQKIGSYTGNGVSASSTQTITTGFKPRWVMFKCTTTADQWIIFDSLRGTVANVTDTYLLANLSQAEADLNNGDSVEFLSNGFKITGDGRYFNQNSETYIYLAIK